MVDTVVHDPTKEYTSSTYPKQEQPAPGLQSRMTPIPNCGEQTYKGSGKLTGRKALITGGDSGIARAAAIAYAREGADVAISYLPYEQPDADEVKTLIENAGQKAVLIPGDLTNEGFCQQMIDQTVKALDGLDILVLSAGMQQAYESISDIPSNILIKHFETNVFSMYWIVKAALKHLPNGASIITTSSVEAYNPSPDLLAYSPTKSAIVAFTKGLAKQLIHQGIRVNSVAPGPIWTPLQIAGGQLQKNIAKFGQDTIYKRAGQPAELAAAYVLLASAESSYVTGQVYGVTGGIPIA
ncbi:SDR family oxidoreductase [Sporolactobacillus terrae]|uniref:NAD(P)-dependent dehydrogenase n=1 Tax=Sporolactobacillus terrae TaxID=269673 RepID=A0A410D8W8_9BACL|nr:SDR family oxidoreductase [Sporolactobacillus terrae]QAA22571.1 NAD(P)-dependent dehydrogenase [Sporolactobacillus terrae]QAA25545.1 NAD(P)-dependent dehydrogenase [Sporolactobacillus terrae]UAK17355.1 SDR family oxidoreductase [Sporolactobacillus terrae]BBN98891.1 putative oxidoreductase YhxD [Sporolactobacillus terrae]